MFKQAVWPHSGHYRPTKENFNDFISFLRENDVDLTDVEVKKMMKMGKSTAEASVLRV